MRIETGLFDNMVVQRTTKTKVDAPFSGRCEATGEVVAEVFRNGKAVKGLGKAKVGLAQGGKFEGVVKGLPVGGPYEIRLSVVDAQGKTLKKTKVKNVLVGDVWMLAGQSNMQGIGDMKHALKPNDKVRVFRMDGRWTVAKDPLHELWKARAEVNRVPGSGNRFKGVGMGVSFGQNMLQLSGGVPQGLIASAHGGTSMTQWDPKMKTEGDKSLYGAMLGRLAENGGRVAGLVWHQGCSDAFDEASAAHYTERMIEFVAEVRRDFGDAKLPVVIGQIGRYAQPETTETAAHWSSVREQERLLAGKIERLLTVSTIDLALDDIIHIGGGEQAKLGKRYAQAMTVLTQGRAKTLPPIEFDSMEVVPSDCGLDAVDIVVKFRNVAGKLKAAGRPAGFTMVEKGRDINCVYRVDLVGKSAVIRTTIPDYMMTGEKALAYGYGFDPYCNIVDEKGRSLPCFGPMPVEFGSPEMCFFPDIEVSVPLAWPGDLAKVGPLGAEVAMRPAVFDVRLVWPPERLTRTPGKDELHYFRFRFVCEKKMRMKMLFGYDGPVKIWIDGVVVFTDPNGTNPIIKDHKTYAFTGAKGEHEIVFALCTNKGKAWGIGVRMAGFENGEATGKGYRIVRLETK